MKVIVLNKYHKTKAGAILRPDNTLSIRQAGRLRRKLCPGGPKCPCGRDYLGGVGEQPYSYKVVRDEKGRLSHVEFKVTKIEDGIKIKYKGDKIFVSTDAGKNTIVLLHHSPFSPYWVVLRGVGKGTTIKGEAQAIRTAAYFLGLVDGFKKGYNKGKEDKYYEC